MRILCIKLLCNECNEKFKLQLTPESVSRKNNSSQHLPANTEQEKKNWQHVKAIDDFNCFDNNIYIIVFEVKVSLIEWFFLIILL